MSQVGFNVERGHPIQVVSRRTGLTADVIRVWERRYRAVAPGRSSANRRIYTDADVERLSLLRRAILCGRRIGEIATMPTAGLRSLVAEDEAATAAAAVPPPRAGAVAPAGAEAYLGLCLEAVRELDASRLGRELAAAAVGLSAPALLEGVVGPLLRHVGEGWREGSLRVCHEHLATAVVRPFLAAMRREGALGGDGPDLVVATPAGQAHELGALMAAVTASLEGWRVTYLGPSLPAEDIAAAVRSRGSRAVALGIVYPADDPRLADELRRLRRLLPGAVRLIVGGAAAPAYGACLSEIGAFVAADMKALRGALESARYERV